MSRLRSILLIGTCLAMPATAQETGYTLYGGPGLIDMPSAAQLPNAQLNFATSYFDGNLRTGINFQIAPRINGTVRHSTISEFGPGGADSSAREFDLHFQLLREDGWRPDLALGFRDLTGDGAHGAEYLVASKSVTDDIRVTAGLGWGRLGTQAGFSAFGDRDASRAGQLQTNAYFRGDAAFFGGVEWRTPVRGLTFTAEYSSDDYAAESAVTSFNHKSPFNFGLTWRPNDVFALSGYYLYGDTVGFQINVSGNPRKPLAPQDLGAGPAPLIARKADAPTGTKWAGSEKNRTKLIEAISEALKADGIIVEEARITGNQVDIYINSSTSKRLPRAVGRTARILAAAMPPSVEVFRITPVEGALPTTTITLRRSDLEAQIDRPDASVQAWRSAVLSDASGHLSGDEAYVRKDFTRFSWGLNPSVPYSVFDPDSEVDLDLQLNASARFQVSRGFAVSAELAKRLDGGSPGDVSAPSANVPQVRSDGGLYYTGRDVELESLSAEYVFKLTPQVYGRVTTGLLERMYAGISTEVLWAPSTSPLAFGAEVNYAKKREHDSPFGLMDYDTVSGHASLYWDTGFHGLEAQVDAGRYLAGDWGATVTLSRRFANGWDVSAYVTRTDISPEDFGEGSYAKGVQVTMPLRWGLPFETRSTASINMSDLSRDGGARLAVQDRLYDRIRDADSNSLEGQWSTFWQ